MSLNKNKILFYFLVFSTSIITAQKNRDDVTDSISTKLLDEVIVTATRTVRQLSSLPLPAQIVSKEQIKSSNSVRLNDILNEQTGLITVPDFGGGEGIQLQGLDSQYILILIDGVPLIGRSAGTLDISRVSVGNIDRIEIVKGASSSLYGSEALGGVINIITEDPKEGFKTTVTYRGGSFNNQDANATISYKEDNVAFSTFINRFSSDGFNLNENNDVNTVDPFSNYTINSRLYYNFSDNTALSISGRYYTQNQDYVPSAVLSGESTINEWNTHIKLEHKYNSKWSSYFEFYTSTYTAEEYLNNLDNSLFSQSYFNQFLVRPEIRGTYNPNEKHTFIGGVGMNHETLDRADFIAKPIFNSPYIYLQYDAFLTEKINIILGARFDSHNEYQSQFSPKAAIRFQLNDKLGLKASIGYGFKTPAFRQLYFDFTNSSVGYTVLGYNAVSSKIPELEAQGQLVNIVVPLADFENELKPESSINFNIGLDYYPVNNLSIKLNLFRNDIKDLIDTRVIANKTNGQNVFSYYNVNRVYTQGLETNISWKPNNNITLSGGYQLLFAKDKDAEEAFENGSVFTSFQLQKDDYFGLYNRSRHMANIKLFYNIEKWKTNANIRSTYRSKYGLFDTNSNLYLDSYDDFVAAYTIWDIAINKTLYKNYVVGFGIDNIFGFTDPQNISNIAGRIIYGKLNIQL